MPTLRQMQMFRAVMRLVTFGFVIFSWWLLMTAHVWFMALIGLSSLVFHTHHFVWWQVAAHIYGEE